MTDSLVAKENDEAALLAKEIYGAIQDASNFSARTMQSKKFQVGVSDLGFCSERVRRMLDQQEAEDTDTLEAFIGTAIGDHVEQAVKEHIWPQAIIQSEVVIGLVGESDRSYTLTGHPDVVLPEGYLIDVKTVFGLGIVRRNGPSDQQQFQRHCYAKAAWEAGMFNDDVALEDVKVANVWIDRSGKEKYAHVDLEPYDEEWVRQAGEWLDDVVYHYLQGEEAAKQPPRELCARYCGFYRTCRAFDTDVEGLIRDRDTLTAVEMYREGLALEKEGKALKKQAAAHLEGVKGSTGDVMVRWVHVNESEVNFTRAAYDKLDIRPIPKPKAAK